MKRYCFTFNFTGGSTMKSKKGSVVIFVCFLFLVGLVFVPSISQAQTEGAAGGAAAGEGAAGAGAAGGEAGAGAAAGLSKGTIAAIVIGAAVIAGGIAAASGGGGGGGHGATVTH
jgi:hypothetical protein